LSRVVLKFVAHGRKVIGIADEFGWRPGARYTNLRDVRDVPFLRRGFLDIHWKSYSFKRHIEAAELTRPFLTVARDVECVSDITDILKEAEMLKKFSEHVIVVPKDPKMKGSIDQFIPADFLLGYSVPTKYGGTVLPPEDFRRPVHLLGGRPDVQRALANKMPVVSFDCNRFTFDARFGDYFDGHKFRPHPKGGYEVCLRDSFSNITRLWADYEPEAEIG